MAAMANLYPSSRAETPVSPLLQTDFPLPPSSHSSLQLQRLSNRGDAFNLAHAPHFSSPGMNMSRSPSISSYSSVAWAKEPATPTNVHPPPAYIAPFGASQVVSETKRRLSDDDGDGDNRGSARSNRDEMQFSPAALALVNAFLDQLLYSMLATAKSTTLTALRPAVIEVLKSRLASDAISSAEEELAELLAGGEEEEEEMNQRQSVAERQRLWDTELVWKRTRLRVMVYIRLGEMEDDDEERHVREDELFHGGDRRFSHSTGLVSWAAAIFLTSVLEYVAEQVLQVAGQAAASRARRQSRSLRVTMSASGMVTPVDGVTVEDYDMEKVALNSTLGRLWRTWRKSLRNHLLGSNNSNGLPPTPTHLTSNNFSRRLSRDHFGGAVMSPTRSSFGNGPESVSAVDDSRPASTSVDDRDGLEDGVEELPEAQYPEHVLAANIPLPMERDERRDVDEIEVPGLARDPDEAEGDGSTTPVEPLHLRRKSLTGSAPWSLIANILQINAESDASVLAMSETTPPEKTALMRRQRSQSVPVRFSPVSFPARDAPEPVPADVETVGAAAAETDAGPKKLPEATEMASQHDEAAAGQPAQSQDNDQTELPASDGHPFDFSGLLGTAAASLTTATAAATAVMYGVSPQASAGYKRFGGAAAGSAAAAAAAVALVYGDSLRAMPCEKIAEDAVEGAAVEKSGTEPVDTPIEKHPERTLVDKKSMVDLIKSGQLEPPPEAEDDHIEERDNQKQLVDTKRLSIPPANKRTSWDAERTRSAEKVPPIEPEFSRDSTTPRAARSPKTSQESFALDDGSELPQPIVRPRHLSRDIESEHAADGSGDIGVARTSDTAVSTGELPQEECYHARDSLANPAPKRWSNIILAPTEEQPALTRQDNPPSPLETEPQLTTPASFLAKRSLTPKALPLEKVKNQAVTGERSRSPVQPSPARSGPPAGLTVSTSQAPAPEKTPSPWRQSFSAAVKESTSWTAHSRKSASVSEPASAVPVQEHPVVFKMGSNKRDSRHKEDSDKNPLTSASIKGPEDFEMFVQGGDTVKYTLTPESVRGGPSPTEAVPRTQATSSRSTDKTPSSPKKQIAVPAVPVEDTRTGRSQVSKQATAASDDDESRSTKREHRRSISRPPVRNTSVHRKSGLMAREPQVLTESTRDFADFIRSTGPSKEPEIRPLVSNRSSISLHSLGREPSIHTPRSHSPAASTRSMTRTVTQAADAPPVPPMPASASTINTQKVNMQPRNAQINNADGTSELIDFIRTGPNGGTASAAGEQRQHRISRTVAPFRTTMDSDQLQEWGDRIAVQPDLKLNTNIPVSSIAPSVRSASSAKSSNRASANSRSALLQNSNTSTTTDNTHPAYADHPPRLTSATPKTVLSLGEAVPKQRFRNKDPYSIDLSDDEDDDLLTALPKNRRQEESLIDFLRNSEPPETNNPRATANGIKSQSASAAVPPPRGSSQIATGGLKTFGADAVSMGRRGSAAARDGPQVPPKTNAQRNGTTAIAVGPITKSRAKLEARNDGPRSVNFGGTTELADFLRSSGPSEPPTKQVDRVEPLRGAGMQTKSSANMNRHNSKASISASTSSKRSLSGFFSSVFGSRRKQQSAGYLDM
ncbi:uncharacterized protein MYCFIDRAFT_215124 [Pseudocercospora fijiensis CIRAD86]|uniref:Uncharacterized protein n=1 Tax=Pseudocercospora fijiensis (strain CIRAD86) TaxID=383855 RepID=M3B0G0_PSEFD|nr:uncharacterized protein MYCFIDRAFT_215124 [Pseudocercospora fijiensis CIRAD86]EME82898.1 hypothetical protein MYCFIDRAFT_215124 [Pseudocercospora fijiensis CIRAD86]